MMIVLFFIYLSCPQLCVHRLVWTEADASDRTDATAVQAGADTTAPGEQTQRRRQKKKKSSLRMLELFWDLDKCYSKT